MKDVKQILLHVHVFPSKTVFIGITFHFSVDRVTFYLLAQIILLARLTIQEDR